ncbi:unnamed protein product [Amoebophrya sp. A120]|nr:unnamed protein product [Amoebophrya sp. A120]|eukprot:GSA120T00018949001.1
MKLLKIFVVPLLLAMRTVSGTTLPEVCLQPGLEPLQSCLQQAAKEAVPEPIFQLFEYVAGANVVQDHGEEASPLIVACMQNMQTVAALFLTLAMQVMQAGLQTPQQQIQQAFAEFDAKQTQLFANEGFDQIESGVRSSGIRHSRKLSGLLQEALEATSTPRVAPPGQGTQDAGPPSAEDVFSGLLYAAKKVGDRVRLHEQELIYHRHIRGIRIVEGLQTPVFVFHDFLAADVPAAVRFLLEKQVKFGTARPSLVQIGVGNGDVPVNLLSPPKDAAGAGDPYSLQSRLQYIGVDTYFQSEPGPDAGSTTAEQLQQKNIYLEQLYQQTAARLQPLQQQKPDLYFLRGQHEEALLSQLPDQSVDLLFVSDLVGEEDVSANLWTSAGTNSTKTRDIETNYNPNAARDPSHPNANVQIRGDFVSDRLASLYQLWSSKVKYGGIMAGAGILGKQVVEAVCDFRTANEVHVTGAGVYWWYVEPPEE